MYQYLVLYGNSKSQKSKEIQDKHKSEFLGFHFHWKKLKTKFVLFWIREVFRNSFSLDQKIWRWIQRKTKCVWDQRSHTPSGGGVCLLSLSASSEVWSLRHGTDLNCHRGTGRWYQGAVPGESVCSSTSECRGFFEYFGLSIWGHRAIVPC
jgi:hypothetical protein